MRTAKDIFNEELSGEPLSEDVVIEAIEIAQNDVINQIRPLCVSFLNEIRDYENESGKSIYSDERESEEFFEIFIENKDLNYIDQSNLKAIKFGRWLLKNASPVFEGEFLTWIYYDENSTLPIYIDTAELFEQVKDKL